MSLDFFEKWARARSYTHPNYAGHVAGQVLLPGSCGSLHHISHLYHVINCDSEGKHPACSICCPNIPRLSQKSHGLQPAKDFLDALPFPLTDRVSSMPRGAFINSTRSVFGVLSHVRSNIEVSRLPDKLLRIISLEASNGNAALPR
jgi:hypothetical protein